jgi:hypothetical protein
MPRTDANRRGCDAAARQRRSRNDAPANSEIATSAQDALSGGNSLADLAARIRAEHEAAGRALRDGLRHAIAAGALLIEAKQQIGKHGAWLPWLAENCSVPERTAQAYMRVARSFGKLDESKAVEGSA